MGSFNIILLSNLFILISTKEIRYDNYQIYRIQPKDNDQVNTIKNLESYGYDIWNAGMKDQPIDIMVTPDQSNDFHEYMKTNKIEHNIIINDLQKVIDSEKNPMDFRTGEDSFFESYHSLKEINKYISEIAEKNPDVTLIIGGRSYEGRNITGIRISCKPGNKAIFIESGIHAREWIGPATTLYIIKQLLTSQEPDIKYLKENYDWYIFPSFNPDGYEYTHTKDRLWRKTRKPNKICVGADPNRNWDHHWGEQGASKYECSEAYRGSEALSEPEIKTMSKFIKSIHEDILIYISFHSYSQLLLFPYGYTQEHADNHDHLLQIANATAETLKQRYGTKYIVGNIYEAIYPASGSSIDWAKGHLKIPIAFTYEFRDTGKHGFILPSDQIIPNSEEVLDSLVTLINETEKLGYN